MDRGCSVRLVESDVSSEPSRVLIRPKGHEDDHNEGLTEQLGVTEEELETTQEDLESANEAADEATDDAEAAKKKASHADSAADKAQAETEQAQAEAQAEKAKSTVVADCSRAYVAAFGDLFEGDDPREQAPGVQKQLADITDDCRAPSRADSARRRDAIEGA